MTPLLMVAAVIVQPAACPAGADLRAELRAIHESARTAHLNGDASPLAEAADERVTMADSGTVRVQSRQEIGAFFADYFKRIDYLEWSDESPPTVTISPDGQLGWMAVAVRARYTRPDQPDAEKTFKSSWIATYRRVGCAWRMTGVASNVVQ